MEEFLTHRRARQQSDIEHFQAETGNFSVKDERTHYPAPLLGFSVILTT